MSLSITWVLPTCWDVPESDSTGMTLPLWRPVVIRSDIGCGMCSV